LELVRLLLDAGEYINAPAYEDRGRTALQAAVEEGHIMVVHLLFAHGADVNADPCPFDGRTCLQAAAEKGRLELVKFLLRVGAEVNTPQGTPMGEHLYKVQLKKTTCRL
jgi:ankyrin repeat protein